ncbi:glycosyltransferase [Amycolatopsis albispora]|uniref:MGT family glycosyl transferase n=1 Tax=Amycolatopsis albispora TaxID=1804986 RepID=A0A344L3J0_9PSEU|nr:glycosyltransferase [Amycolatopsis albispora]AXB42614.1 MGT family glycosyl transferase [Amycolatopsis albispora]
MRILFTFAGGTGHFNPLAPIARAAEAAGHQVAFAGQEVMLDTVRAAGFTAFGTGGDTFGARERQPLAAIDLQREELALREGYARKVAGERCPRILELCREWRADLVVCDEADFGAVVAAEALGLPHATVLVIAAGSLIRPDLVGEPLNELRARHGLPPDPGMAMLGRHLVLSPFPPSYRNPDFPLPATAHSLTLDPVVPDVAAPGWLRTDAPTVYFTLGTVFNTESGDLFQRVLTGLRALPVNLVMTVGPHIDPAEFGPQPESVRIEQYVPQASLLPWCAAMVSHGGSGSVLGALAHGLPMVLLPMGADQPHNAERCAELGVARVLDALTATAGEIGAATQEVLRDNSYREAAARMREEITALPGAGHAVRLLEDLVRGQ